MPAASSPRPTSKSIRPSFLWRHYFRHDQGAGPLGFGVHGGIFVQSAKTFSGGITNSGVVAPELVGIAVFGVSNFSGNVSNAGTISAAASGIFVGNTSTFTGTITNNGKITAATYGIDVALVTTFTGSIVNSGTVSAPTAIRIANHSTIVGSILDSGVILATNLGISVDATSEIVATKTAIKISGPSFTGGISNAGTISAANTAYLRLRRHGLWRRHHQCRAGVGPYSGSFFCLPRLDLLGQYHQQRHDFGRRLGIDVLLVSQFTGGITNSGSIAARGVGIDVTFVTQFGSTTAGGITNSGKVAVTQLGIEVGNVTSFFGNISNSGTITSSTNASMGVAIFTVGQFRQHGGRRHRQFGPNLVRRHRLALH